MKYTVKGTAVLACAALMIGQRFPDCQHAEGPGHGAAQSHRNL